MRRILFAIVALAGPTAALAGPLERLPGIYTNKEDVYFAAMLRRARTATCWGAGLKTTRKGDGSEDWLGTYNLKLHDQGGRVAFGGGDTGTPPVVLRMRNVIWPSGPNKPSLVLYVHTPDQPDHAVSYAWADPGATRIGINLRWMQASCAIDSPNGGQ